MTNVELDAVNYTATGEVFRVYNLMYVPHG